MSTQIDWTTPTAYLDPKHSHVDDNLAEIIRAAMPAAIGSLRSLHRRALLNAYEDSLRPMRPALEALRKQWSAAIRDEIDRRMAGTGRGKSHLQGMR